MAVIFKQLSDPLPRPRQFVPDLPEAVERVLFKALAKKPQERYADAEAFAAALENLEGMTASAPPARANADSSETIDTLETI
jgi:serine/threonine-protein kinase